MKTLCVSLLLLFVISFSSESLHAQEFPKIDASPMDLALARPDKDSPPLARVIYSRPVKNGRKIFGELVPYGNVWRTGANEATELTLYIPMKLGDTVLDEGTYTLYTIPDKDSWTVIVNCDTNVWGSYSYSKFNDMARINVPTKKPAAPVETLSMAFKTNVKGTTLLIGWDTVYIEIPFKKI
ncbi:DUF2911 domain-containing protein [Ulvibacter litoralis]|uniref:DUF2911 domain-containing protein n=1 Tax=Ulvibacter litoralis TaxID=227084 RepID=A0A1G7BTH7_9FLAO|nr:DUF2911 domain-containing protein [Ulvibacter litoralis]GHC49804.1 hypothetical protein GCM10008083_11750 [Ulvibacter litoralis]SDE30444.1 Protein of unknown function [Ulvibacter litoralis]